MSCQEPPALSSASRQVFENIRRCDFRRGVAQRRFCPGLCGQKQYSQDRIDRNPINAILTVLSAA